jgi:hypothetical protein
MNPLFNVCLPLHSFLEYLRMQFTLCLALSCISFMPLFQSAAALLDTAHHTIPILDLETIAKLDRETLFTEQRVML